MTENGTIGKIHLIECKNFVTYDYLKMSPGESLNIILGPNGTGKSTVIAAIVIGMGGKPKILARSSNIENYIKNGCNNAWIKIYIYKNVSRETKSFGIKFDLTGKCQYKIDNQDVSQKEYLRCVLSYNINVNNLCQFLPQDRVQDFSKMNSQELLTNTLNSICNADIIEKFIDLKEYRNEQLNQKHILMMTTKKLKEAEQESNSLKNAIEHMNVRKKYLLEFENCQRKKAWIECTELKEQLNELKIDLDNAKKVTERHQQDYNESKEKLAEIYNFIENSENKLHNNENKCNELLGTSRSIQTKSNNLIQTIKEKKSEFESKIQEEKERVNTVNKTMALLQASVQDLKNARDKYGLEKAMINDITALSKEIDEVSENIKDCLVTRDEINVELNDNFPDLQNIKREIYSIENIKERRLININSRWPDVYRGVLWLRQNRHIFEEQIYEPLILELNINNPENAKYFENTIPTRDLIAFTCVNKNDVTLLLKKLCNEQKLNINVLYSDKASICKYKANESITKYKLYGFHSYLTDLIEGPAPILNYLCKAYNIHKIMVGTENAGKYAEELPHHVKIFFTPTSRFTITHSKYTTEKTSTRNKISTRNILCLNFDKKRLNTLKENLKHITHKTDILKNKRSEIEAKINEYEQKKNEIILRKQNIVNNVNKLNDYCRIIKVQKQRFEYLIKNKINITEEKKKLKYFSDKFLPEVNNTFSNMLRNTKEYAKFPSMEMERVRIQLFKLEHTDLIINDKKLLAILNNSKNIFNNIKKKYEIVEKNYEEKLKKAMDLCDGKKMGTKNFPYTEIFSYFPNDIVSLCEHMDEIQARLDCMNNENPTVFDDYEHVKQTIENLQESIETINNKIETLEKQITDIHNEWYPNVIEIIDKINENFTKFMSKLDYAGEICLTRTNEYDYDSYGIQIMVKYRNDAKLQILDRFVQSGGERAVAIAVYSLSLQHLTTAPFRCVDEINQGMDPGNERKIFEFLVNETDGLGLPQYFFVTPKLLPKLKYNKHMSVHIVFNTKFISKNVF